MDREVASRVFWEREETICKLTWWTNGIINMICMNYMGMDGNNAHRRTRITCCLIFIHLSTSFTSWSWVPPWYMQNLLRLESWDRWHAQSSLAYDRELKFPARAAGLGACMHAPILAREVCAGWGCKQLIINCNIW